MIIVTGFPRSGTSAMCAALEAGGLRVHKNGQRNRAIHSVDTHEGYRVQPGDVYEPSVRERKHVRFPLHLLHADVVKVVIPWLGDVAPMPADAPGAWYRVIVMVRDYEEIRQSNEGAFGDRYVTQQISSWYHRVDAWLLRRADVQQVGEVFYRDLVHAPAAVLGSLDITIPNVEAGAAAIDPDRYRFRREHLIEGATMGPGT